MSKEKCVKENCPKTNIQLTKFRGIQNLADTCCFLPIVKFFQIVFEVFCYDYKSRQRCYLMRLGNVRSHLFWMSVVFFIILILSCFEILEIKYESVTSYLAGGRKQKRVY